MTDTPATPEFKCGFVGMAGAPNAGKSTLVNRLVGQKVSITSRLPQTTRHRVCGIFTDETMQAVFVDLPGILAAESVFNETLVDCARESLRDADLVLHLRDPITAGGADDQRVIETLRGVRAPIWEVWNKTDLNKPIAPELLQNPALKYEAGYLISAKTGKGVDRLMEGIRERLPAGPAVYPVDDVSDRDLRFLAAEAVREKIFLYLRQEVPYGIATWTDTWEDRDGRPAHVRVIIQTEREAHKSIIIGAKGASLKKIGTAARQDIEALVGGPVFLELHVQVKEKWRKDEQELIRLGLRLPKRGR